MSNRDLTPWDESGFGTSVFATRTDEGKLGARRWPS